MLDRYGIDGLTQANIEAYFAELRSRPVPASANTLSTYWNHLTCLTDWLVAMGHLSESPMPARRPKPGRTKPRPLTDDEVARIMSVATGDLRAWVELGIFAGLRAHEIAKVRGSDISGGYLYVDGKGGRRDVLPLHPRLAALAETRPRGYWFPKGDGHVGGDVVTRKVGNLFHALGIDGSSHRCRHYFATRLLRNGVNVRVVQELMRHASLATTQVYLGVTGEDLSSAVHSLAA